MDWSLFSAVILFYHWFPLLEKVKIQAFILPATLIIFTGPGGAGRPSLMSSVRAFLNYETKFKLFRVYIVDR